MNEDQWIYGQVKTRLSYEEYFKANILNVMEYKWIRDFYNKSLNELRRLIDSSSKDSKTYVRLNPIISKISGPPIDTLFTLFDIIAKEEKALADAKQAYKEGAEKPEVWKHTKTVTGADGKPKQITETGRNVPAYEEKMKKLQAEVDLHEKILQQLKSDLVNIAPKKDEKK